MESRRKEYTSPALESPEHVGRREKGGVRCSNGVCPGVLINAIILTAWVVAVLGSWAWGLITG